MCRICAAISCEYCHSGYSIMARNPGRMCLGWLLDNHSQLLGWANHARSCHAQIKVQSTSAATSSVKARSPTGAAEEERTQASTHNKNRNRNKNKEQEQQQEGQNQQNPRATNNYEQLPPQKISPATIAPNILYHQKSIQILWPNLVTNTSDSIQWFYI